MQSLLPPIEGLIFDPKVHRYQIDGVWLTVSPTKVLSQEMSNEVKQRIEETRHIWEPRGNTVHNYLEQLLLGAAELNAGEYTDWTSPLRDCWLWKDCTVYGVEMRLVDRKRRMAGSCDFLIKTARGTMVLGDLKTVSSIEALKRRKPAEAQLGAYLRMLNQCYREIHVERCVTVVAAPGETKVIASEPDVCSHEWEDAWEKWKAAQDVEHACLGF